MKHIVVATALLTAAVAVNADPVRLVNADASPLSEICIAAVESRNSALDVASDLGITINEMDQLYCNEMPLTQFIRTYRAPEKKVEPTYVFKSTDETMLTELCMASLKSDEEFASVKARVGEEVKLSEVMCNNMSISEFARKYRKSTLTASIQ